MIGAWVFTEVSALVLDAFSAPPYFLKTILVVIAIGFPIWLVFSWVYDLTPEGIKKTSNTRKVDSKSPKINLRLNRAIIAFLTIAVVLLGIKQFRTSPEDKTLVAERVENSINLIAVLPFYNTKSDPETDYLGFAMADQIIGSLVYLNNITVRPSASIRQYEQQSIDPKQAGDDLQVDYVLIGNYLKEGNKIRLNVELINVSSNNIIWRKPIEVDFQSAFELQDIVAQEVIEGMNVQFSQKELNRIRKDIPKDPLAYEYFLRSISYDLSNEGDQLAIDMLRKSIELDSTYAPAYQQLGDRLHRLATFGFLDTEVTRLAENAYLKALSLNSDLMSALGNLAMLYTDTNRISKAVEFTKKILELNPNDAHAHFSLGYIYRYAGMNNEAIEQMEKAVSLDPKNQGFRSITITYLFAGQYEKVLDSGERFKKSPFILSILSQALVRLDRKYDALKYVNEIITNEPEGLEANIARGIKASIEGNIENGLTAAHNFEHFNLTDAEPWYFTAGNYGLLGDIEGCIRCLQRAVDNGFFNYPFMNKDPFLDAAREDPEFQKVLQKAKEKHLAFKERFF